MNPSSPPTSGGDSRNYGIDLLRMLAMYMVCMLHFIGQGGILYASRAFPRQHAIAWKFEIAAFCAVNCFALISGYVGNQAKFKYRNLFRLWLQALFYSAGIALIFYFVKPGSVGKMDLVQAFLPVCTGEYWYLTAYALMFFLIPQMNYLLRNQGKNVLKAMLWTFFVLFSLFSVIPIVETITKIVELGYSAIWLAYLYMLGGFIKIYGIGELLTFSAKFNWENTWLYRFSPKVRHWAWIGVYILCIKLAYLDEKFVNYNTPFILIAAVALLMFFSQLKITHGKAIIGMASPLAFSVYLIQNQRQIWEFVFQGAFVQCAGLPVWKFRLALLGIPLAIYLACSAIDFFRKQLFRLLKIN